jgi:predicted amidophosphoribosyltransferase
MAMLAKFSTITGLASFIAASLVSHLTQTLVSHLCLISQAEICPCCEAFIEFISDICKYFSQPIANVLIEGENKLKYSLYLYIQL